MGRRNIVLDLDECLIHTFGNINDSDIGDVHTNTGNFLMNFGSMYMAMERPGLKYFLNFCSNYFDNVIIWSAGKYGYVHQCVKIIMEGIKEPELILTYNDCEFDDIGNTLKPLWKVFEKIPGASHSNTIAVDDRNDNYIGDDSRSVLKIPPFSPTFSRNIVSDDDELYRVVGWFVSDPFTNSEDIRTLDKSIFRGSSRRRSKSSPN